MPRPDKPVADTEIRHDTFGQAVVNYAGEQLRFVRRTAGSRYFIENLTPHATGQAIEAEITQLPANNPRVRQAVVFVIVRATSGGDNIAVELLHPTGAPSLAIAYTGGTANAGGMNGPYTIPVGGTNGRSIQWKASASCKVWIGILGWWETV